MIKKITILFLSLVLYTSCFAQQEADLVRESFNNYKTAILNGDGVTAVTYVDSITIAYYSDILEKTITADSMELDSTNILAKLLVFTIRQRAPKEEILAFNGESLLIYAIEEGMIGKNSVADTEIGEVIIKDDFAQGQFVANNHAAPYYFNFYKKNDKWKIDLTSIFDLGITALKKMVVDTEQQENEFLFMLLEMMSGVKSDHNLWESIDTPK